ncbi:MAG: CBU_0592 family membrane protein [Paracoccaceae bacterium]
MSYFDFTPAMIQAIGVGGFFLYVANYTMLTLRILTGDCLRYFVLNITAASMVLIGLSVNFNLAAALIQSFWIVMSLIGIAMRLRRRILTPV